MRTVFWAAFLANVVLAVVSWLILPERVAIHFGRGGGADGWAPGYVNTLLFLGMDLLLFVSIYFSPRLVFLFPARWTNLPNRDYWLAPENRPRTAEKMAAFTFEFGAALFLFLFLVGLLTIEANLAATPRLNEPVFFGGLVLFLAYTVTWCIRYFRSFRLPGPGAATASTGG